MSSDADSDSAGPRAFLCPDILYGFLSNSNNTGYENSSSDDYASPPVYSDYADHFSLPGTTEQSAAAVQEV